MVGGASNMVSRTSGGLIKRSMSFDEGQLRQMERMASERYVSLAAVVRGLIDLGLRVEKRRKEIGGPVEDLVTDVVAREVA